MNNDWYLLKNDEVLNKLDTDLNGLSKNESKKRLSKYGLNQLPKGKKKSFLNIFISQFKNSIVYILIIAMLISFVIGEITDGLFILIVILSDAILGAIQEYKSNKNAESLASLIKSEARVIRGGEDLIIDAKYLVPGDIVLLESGNIVPADMRIIESQNLSIDESVLTGETLPRDKNSHVMSKEVIVNDRDNMAYIATSVMRGRAKCVVVETGENTEIGKIASEVLLKEDTKTPLQIRMDKFTKQLGIILSVLALIITFVLYYKNYTTREIFFLVVALSVSAIPEGLPVVITLSLSISSNKMAKKNVLVKKLNAVETLGSVTVIASDKTGTLTLNEQTVKKILLPNDEEYIVTGIGYNGNGIIESNNGNLKNIEKLITEGVINNESTLLFIKNEWVSLGDSMDTALLALGYKYNLDVESLSKIGIAGIPYESENGYGATFYKKNNKTYVAVKGTLEKILKFCNQLDNNHIREQNEKLVSEGYRVLAFATGEVDNLLLKEDYNEKDLPQLEFLGLVAFIDPIREDAKQSIKECKEAGIKVVMITGDHPLTAYDVGKKLGIIAHEEEVTTGAELEKIRLDGDIEFDNFVKNKRVFARVTPIQKLEIVESFKRQGEFIAVSGDGVNDCPALKAANVGVAMGSGTDTAKETGQMIITDDKFTSIVKGVEEGRIAYNNVRKVTYMLLSCGVCEVIFYMLSIFLDYPTPLTAIQLLWLNLVTDGIQDVALAFEAGEKNIMKRKPRNPNESLFDSLLIKEICVSGLVMGLIVFGVWFYLIEIKNFDIVTARSYTLLLMVFIQNVHVFNCRSEIVSIFKKKIKDNINLVIGIILVLLLQIFVSESVHLSNFLEIIPIPIKDMLILFLLATPVILISEAIKFFERLKRGIK